MAARSPAETAGLRRGEVVYKVGRFDINNAQDMETLLASAKPGTSPISWLGPCARCGAAMSSS